ncbi:MAG TPA: hypothetical protein VN853_11840 [Polyangia bacterium]|nr:hypothetical protein [Polyangia bacterium]
MDAEDKRRLLYEHTGELFREMAVLVVVFGILDALIQRDLPGWPIWVLTSVVVSIMAFALGHWCAVEAGGPEENE